ncbi:hypothetical protein T261_02417 [Streptomyces lydicus]|nr:hypothetical protein T261_02417 [Streptomyces lydicus]
MPAGGRPVADGDVQGGAAGVERDAQPAAGRAAGAALADPAAQQALDAGGVGGGRRVRVVEGSASAGSARSQGRGAP